ncbi:MAG: ABC transporter permease subunit [Bacillota bacterium]
MTLLRQQIKAEGPALLIWGLSLGGLSLYSMTLWKTLMESDAMGEVLKMLETLPPAMKGLIGGGSSLLSIDGWVQAYAFGQWFLVPYLVFTGLFAASIVSREMDRRTMEFLLSLPTSRAELLLSRWGGMALGLAVLQGIHLLGTIGGVLMIGESPAVGSYLLAELNLWLLLLALGTLFLLISLFIDDYGRAVGITLGAGFALFFTHIGLEGQTGAAEKLRNALPFAQFRPAVALAEGAVPVGAMLYLALLTLAALGLSIFLFQRKQIAV